MVAGQIGFAQFHMAIGALLHEVREIGFVDSVNAMALVAARASGGSLLAFREDFSMNARFELILNSLMAGATGFWGVCRAQRAARIL